MEAPVEEIAYKSFKDQGLIILNVFPKSTDEDIKKFAETFHLTFPVGGDNGMTEIFKITRIPVTIFIGKDGEIKKRIDGTTNYKTLHNGIRELLQ